MRFFLLLSMALSGCASLNQKLNPNLFYKREIGLVVNGASFNGVAVPTKSNSYHIKVLSAGVIDMITIRSCHREVTFEPTIGWFESGKKFEYEYSPIDKIETERGCLLDIGTYEKDKGRQGWALIALESDDNISANLKCNGENLFGKNTSICQGRAGTIQEIKFDHKVLVSPESDCDVMKTEDNLNYSYFLPKGECDYYFCDQTGKCHEHITLGYEDVLVRKAGQ